MKINRNLFKIIFAVITVVLIMLCNFSRSYAIINEFDNSAVDFGDGSSNKTETPTNSDSQPSGSGSVGQVEVGLFKPTVADGKIFDIAEMILGWIQALGGICITVFVALTGFGTILGSAGEKAVAKEKYMGYIIAAVILTCGSTLARIIIAVGEAFG